MNFTEELEQLINKHSLENHSNTPDFILAAYLVACLEAFNQGVVDREQWYNSDKKNTPPKQAERL